MTLTVDNIRKTFPLPTYNYKVRFGPDSYAFSQASGLNLQYDTITYRHGLSWFEGETQMPGRQQALNITLERGVVSSGSVLLEWIQSVRLGSVTKQDVIIDLCDENGTPTVSWTVQNAFPTQLEAPTLSASGNEVAIERLQLMGNGLLVEYHE